MIKVLHISKNMAKFAYIKEQNINHLNKKDMETKKQEYKISNYSKSHFCGSMLTDNYHDVIKELQNYEFVCQFRDSSSQLYQHKEFKDFLKVVRTRIRK